MFFIFFCFTKYVDKTNSNNSDNSTTISNANEKAVLEIGTYKKIKSLNIDDSYPNYIVLKNNNFYIKNDSTSTEYLFGTYKLDEKDNVLLYTESQDLAFFNASEIKLKEVDGKINLVFLYSIHNGHSYGNIFKQRGILFNESNSNKKEKHTKDDNDNGI